MKGVSYRRTTAGVKNERHIAESAIKRLGKIGG
jgi:hypothetical protein